ncbi:hypothetical protein [Rhizobium grahamii]|uniref:Transmembrane protein n=1 Tax=Rhizobium grahamii CCGE 502 TaxID=990285 RepID=S3HVX2_9HYPH|nr:hypothetical protein [Rhizobium grahamii]EPE97331.1 hypothetical protein RGCCGE502_14820 [Rhizobium grahamii CCGE 502]
MNRLRSIYLVVLGAAVACMASGAVSAFAGPLPAGKLLNSAAALLGLASVLQLRVSGWFDFVMEEYGDQEKYPFGPPSHITRQIIETDDPNQPIVREARNILFVEAETGFKLGVASLVVALAAAWF